MKGISYFRRSRIYLIAMVCLAAGVGPVMANVPGGGAAEVATDAAMRLSEAAVGAAFGAAEAVDATPYLDPDMNVSAYAVECAQTQDGSIVTVIASARRDDVPVVMMWKGLPKHRDPEVLAAARRRIQDALGVVVSDPTAFFWLDAYELWARFPEVNPQTGGVILCNLYTGEATTFAEIQAGWQNRQRNAQIQTQGSDVGATAASPERTVGRTADQAAYIKAQWAAADDLLAAGEPGATGISAQGMPHPTQYIASVPNLNQQIRWEGQVWEGNSQIVAAMDVLLFWDTRGYDRLVDGDDLDAVHGDLREAMLWDRGSSDANTAFGLAEFINGPSCANQYSFLVELFDLWTSPYPWPSFDDCRREIDSGRPALFGVKNYTDDPANSSDFEYRDHMMCAVGYFDGHAFSGSTSTQWVVVHDNWGGGDAADPYHIDDEPFIDWNRATDSLIRVQPNPAGTAVTCPSAPGIVWRCGEGQEITWTGFTGSDVKIELYKGVSLHRTIASSTANDGLYAWTVPGTQEAGSDFRVKVTSISNPSQFDDSDDDFTIMDMPRVVFPAASKITWDRGSSYEIAWSGFTGASVMIELCRGLVVDRTITPSTANTGSFTWTVPGDQPLGADYRIRITSISDGSQFDYSDSEFAIADVPHVAYPTAARVVWGRGIAYTITWDGFPGPSVVIELYNGSRLDTTLARSADNAGSFSWTVPGDHALGTDFRIKVTSTSDVAQYDVSDNPFEIKDISTVTYPTAAGITWKPGESRTITWAGFTGATVKIDLYKGSSLARTIASSATNNGAYPWTVPTGLTLGSDYKIRVTSADRTQSDDSDNFFTIANPRVTYPTDAGVVWKVGESRTITWTGFVGAEVRIELYDGRTLNRIIAQSTANDGSHGWTIPVDQTSGSSFTIRVTSASDASQSDDSDNAFAIGNPRVTYPTDTGITWKIGESPTITWSGFNGASVAIELYKGSSLNRTLAASTANTGSYRWTVPADQTLGSDFKIRITSTSDRAQTDESDNVLTIANPRVTYPTDAGVAWKVGESRTITWTGFIGSDVRIELYDGRTLNRTIVPTTRNTGSYAWTIPADQTPGSSFIIRVTSTTDASQSDDSDNAFAITNPRVTYPTDAGITWKIGESHTITWTGFNGSFVTIALYKGSSLNRTIAASAANNGSYPWTVPSDQIVGSDYKIRITSNSDRTQFDESDNSFTIANPQVTYPTSSGIAWRAGDSPTITWTGFTSASVKIDLYKGTALNRTIVASTANNGSYPWTVPSDQAAGSDFIIRITSTSDVQQTDDSDNAFTILNPHVTYPTAAGVFWGRGGTYTITWDGFIDRAVVIELYKGEVLNRTIAASTDNTGSYPWTVPGDQTTGTDFKIRITAASDRSQSDLSDNPFTIDEVPCPPKPVALWRFEPTDFVNDSVGKNHLTNDGAAIETTDRREGAGCANLKAGERDSLTIYDDWLSTNFPARNGDPNVVMTLCFWMKPRSFPFNGTVISKYQIATDTRSWRLYFGSVPAYHLRLGLGRRTGEEFTDYPFSQTSELLVANHWYHVAYSYRASDRYYHVRIWDATDNVLRVEREAIATAPMAVTNAPIVLGNTPLESSYFDGLLDEVAVFNSILTSSQIDKIRRGECRLY